MKGLFVLIAKRLKTARVTVYNIINSYMYRYNALTRRVTLVCLTVTVTLKFIVNEMSQCHP